jgi:hypothetical protein
MRAFDELAARPIHACKRPDCSHLYTSEVLAAETAAREGGTPLSRERTEGDADQLETYAFDPDKVITFDGTFFPNASAMRDAKESGLHNIQTELGPGAPTMGGGFTPLSVGGLWPTITNLIGRLLGLMTELPLSDVAVSDGPDTQFNVST